MSRQLRGAFILFASLTVYLLCSRDLTAAQQAQHTPIDFWSDYPPDILSAKLVSLMSDEELLAQIFMFGWAGDAPSDLLNTWVRDRGLGSVKVFGWNTDDTAQVARAVASLQKEAASRHLGIPLFVATDQEGGWIRHIKGNTSETPGNLAIGASAYPADAWYSGYYIARELAALGINMNFAPTVDIFTHPGSTVIGPRSFGSSPEYCSVLGSAFSAGSLEAGVLSTAKHFPGHGDTDLDSHASLPRVFIDEKTLMERELIPFISLIREGVSAVMSAHISFPLITKDEAPASLSHWFLTDLLRERLGFEGLIITDDITMNGATLFAGSLSAAVRMAIEAGNDIIVSSTTAGLTDALWRLTLSLMKSSPQFRQRVGDAAQRVIHTKLQYFKESPNPAPCFPDIDEARAIISDDQAQKFFLSQACRSITLSEGSSLPYSPSENERILLIGQKQFSAFFDEARKHFPQADFFSFDYQMGPIQTEWMQNRLADYAAGYDTLIFSVADRQSAQLAQAMKSSGAQVIIISVLSPVPAFSLDWADTLLYAYSYAPVSYQAAFAVLTGEIEASGTMPVQEIRQ